MITLIYMGQAVMTLVYKFMTDQLFEAIEGHGAKCNIILIKVTQRHTNRAWIEISTPFDNPDIADRLKSLRPLINGYTITHDFTLIPSGYLDGNIVKGSGGGP